MNDKIYSIEQIKTMLTPVFSDYDIKKAILFGSYVNGKATSDSDLDLLVDSRLRGLDFVGFMQDVSDAVNKEVDLFDITHIESNSPMDMEVKNTGISIYEK